MALPNFAAFKATSNGKYLSYEEGETQEFLKFTGEELLSPYVKFELEMAYQTEGNEGVLVHIRSCYNNRYWTRVSEDDTWLVAAATKKQEDHSNWSCTLFKPVIVDDDAKTFRFVHVQSGNYACLWSADDPFDSCLRATAKDRNSGERDVFTVIDWESLVILPKIVTFKGENDFYFKAYQGKYSKFLQFASTDLGDPLVRNEVFTNKDGSIRLKNNYFGKFWTLGESNWITLDADEASSDNPQALFWPVKVDSNVIALRNLGNNNFCKGLIEDQLSWLNAALPSITKEARLILEEPLISREIYNVRYRLKGARIYNKKVVRMDTQVAENRTRNDNDMKVILTYAESKSSTWDASVSHKFGVKVSFKAGIPIIGGGGIEVSTNYEFDSSYRWGETNKTEMKTEYMYHVTVPPMTRVTVSMIASKASCDVPFSYTRRDTHIDGAPTIKNMDDGIFSGINCFDVRFQTNQEQLSHLKNNEINLINVCG